MAKKNFRDFLWLSNILDRWFCIFWNFVFHFPRNSVVFILVVFKHFFDIQKIYSEQKSCNLNFRVKLIKGVRGFFLSPSFLVSVEWLVVRGCVGERFHFFDLLKFGNSALISTKNWISWSEAFFINITWPSKICK